MQKKTKFLSVDDLHSHPFVSTALPQAIKVSSEISFPKNDGSFNLKWKRDVYEDEAYHLRIGNSLSHFLSSCRQICDCILYLKSFTPTKKMVRSGITRHSHLLYSIENYIIRTQTVYDRLLKVIDTVYHLWNIPEEISHKLIVNNVHVKKTELPAKLKKLRKLTKRFYSDRNKIIHSEEYQDDNLRILEGYTILLNDFNSQQDKNINILLPKLTKKLITDIIKKKEAEYLINNQKMFEIIIEIFDTLLFVYNNRKKRLELVFGNITK